MKSLTLFLLFAVSISVYADPTEGGLTTKGFKKSKRIGTKRDIAAVSSIADALSALNNMNAVHSSGGGLSGNFADSSGRFTPADAKAARGKIKNLKINSNSDSTATIPRKK